LDGADQRALAMSSIEHRFDQETGCALAVSTGDSGNRQALRRTLVEVSAHTRERAPAMRNLGPGDSRTPLLRIRIGDDRNRSRGDSLIDVLIAVARLAAHGDKDISRPHAARIVLDAGDRRITGFGKNLGALEELAEGHLRELYGYATLSLEMHRDSGSRLHMRARQWLLATGDPAPRGFQIQPVLRRKFDGASDRSSQERWNDNPALLNIQDDCTRSRRHGRSWRWLARSNTCGGRGCWSGIALLQ